MEYVAMLVGSILVILLIAGLIYFFGNVLRVSLFKDFGRKPNRDAAESPRSDSH